MSKERQGLPQRIFAAGRGANDVLLRKFCQLTGKDHPRICFLPTASGDREDIIALWRELGDKLQFKAVIQKLFISTFDQPIAFVDVLLNCDAIYVGGGNTVNMLAIWREHGIDTILQQALESGILLGGGSAGGICWFEGGLTDSRPIELTSMKALGWLKGSFAPHYLTEPGRRRKFHQYILDDSLANGYGCNDDTALLFQNGEFVNAYSSNDGAQAFYVRKDGQGILEEPISTEYIQ